MDDLPVDAAGNIVFPPEEQFRERLFPSDEDPFEDLNTIVFSFGDGTENRGDAPRLMILD